MNQAVPSDSNLRPSDTAPGDERVEAEKTNGGASGEATATQEETKVIYHIDEEETPYKVTVSFLELKIKVIPNAKHFTYQVLEFLIEKSNLNMIPGLQAI